jgi:NAD(P)H-hydrate epimerase
MRLVTAEEMRVMDRATIDGGHVTGEVLMERAGAGVVRAMAQRYGPLLALRVLVLCGRGSNGGDGFVAARRLLQAGAIPHVVVLGDAAKIAGDAQRHLWAMRDEGIVPVAVESDAELHRAARGEWDFALDAMLGTGAEGPPRGLFAAGVEVLRELDDRGVRVVAVDLPTGLDADTGAIARRTVRADLTVTFGAPKRGQYLYPGRAFVGALEVVDIGLIEAADARALELATEAAMAALVPLRDPRAHKGTAGRLLVIGGSAGMTGSVTLAARAANRAGAGYVRVAVPASLADILALKLTEEIPLAMPETRERSLGAAARRPLLEAARGAHAVVIGPGLSSAPASAALVRKVAAAIETPLLIDADGLNAFAGHLDALRAMKAPAVLTPHLGELSRLSGEDARALEVRRIDAAREYAWAFGAVVVVKGAPTVTAAPDGRATLNPNGNPGLATLGSGDVLSGAIGALLAQGLEPYDAARLGVWLHGAAGDLAAERFGVHGMTAGDLIDAVALALRALVRVREEVQPGRSRPAEEDTGRGDGTPAPASRPDRGARDRADSAPGRASKPRPGRAAAPRRARTAGRPGKK